MTSVRRRISRLSRSAGLFDPFSFRTHFGALVNINGSYKNELIHTGDWADTVDVEIATIEWMNWWNDWRLHQSFGYRTPAEVESEFWKHNPTQK